MMKTLLSLATALFAVSLAAQPLKPTILTTNRSDPTQFGNASGVASIKSGANTTNQNFYGTNLWAKRVTIPTGGLQFGPDDSFDQGTIDDSRNLFWGHIYATQTNPGFTGDGSGVTNWKGGNISGPANGGGNDATNFGKLSGTQLIITGGPNWFGQSYMTNGFTATNTDSTKVPMTIGMSGSSTNWFEVRTNGVIAAYGTNDTLNVPKIVAGNLVVATNFSIYASGTAYTLTGSSAALTFGTTSPSLTINLTGTYLITANAGIKYASATYAGAQTATLKLRRTNNTAADLSNGSRAVEMPVLTTFTGGDVFSLPPVIYAATAGDVITIFGILSATPSAGSVQTDSAEIVAVRVAP